MDNRKIKLGLSIELLKMQSHSNILKMTKEVMLGWQEVGAFLGFSRGNDIPVSSSSRIEQYALQFENCTLNIDVLANSLSKTQLVQGFQLV